MLHVWSWFVRLSHWLLVTAFTVAFIYSDSIWDIQTHVLAGYAAGAILLARVVWGILAKGYCNFAKFPFRPMQGLRYAWSLLTGQARRFIGHNPAGSVVIYAMLGIGLLTVGSGLMVLNNTYLPISYDRLDQLHGIAAWSWLGLVVMHVCGVVTESLLHRENLIATMITGLKHRHLGDKKYLNHGHRLHSDHS